MEIKSSLLNEHDYKFVKQSLIQASLVDGEQDTRVKICHFLVDNAVDSDTEFFLENFMFLRFPDPNADGIGWTDKNGLIYLNCPTKQFENKPVYWDFVYCHECLHQIWGTFEVEEKLIREFGADKFNHQILNIASDCVINDWLSFKYKKKYPDIGLITPEYLKEQFDIEYDRNVDTQYGLYLKLIEHVDELLKDKNIQDQLKKHFERDSKIKDFQDELDKIGELDDDDDDKGPGPTPPPPPPPPRGPWHPDAKEAEAWAKDAQYYADEADKKAKELEQKDPNKGAIMRNRASIAQEAADASKDAAKKSRECADNGDKEGEEENARKAADFCGVAEEAFKGKKTGGGKNDDDDDDNDGPIGPRAKDGDSEEDSSSAQDSADKAQAAANRAQKAADNWKDKAQKDPSAENKKAADNAQKAADEAKEAANKAQAAADKAKDAAKKGNASGEAKADVEAAKAAKDAEEAAQRAQEGLEKQQSGNGTAAEANDAQKEAEDAAAAAKSAAQQKEEEAKQNGSKEAKEAAEYAKSAAEDAEEAANAAKKAAQEARDAKQRGDKEAEAEAAEKAKRAAEDAKDAAKRAQNGKKTANHDKRSGGTTGTGDYTFEPEDLDRIRNERQKLNKRYANELGGALGEFANKCRKSLQLNPSMIAARTNKGKSSWKAKLETGINAFVKNKLRKFKQYEQTYKRIRRGTGVPKMGDIIKPGKRIKDNRLDIRVGFYVDRSGSMCNCLNQVWEALYRIGDGLVKNFGRDKYVEDVSFDVFAFDTKLYKVNYGKKMSTGGNTMSFDTLMGYIEKNTKDNLVNIILTDAGFFGCDLTKVKEIISQGNLFVFITNDSTDQTGIKKLSEDKNITNLIYIQADANFTI